MSGRGLDAPVRDGFGYPLYRKNDRVLPPDWKGPVYLWDIDNTYLVTEWSGLRDLVRIRFEAAEDKRPVPGAVELLAALRRSPSSPSAPPAAQVAHERAPVYFVSASPETMRGVLERRMLIDGVVHDGITFRNLRKLGYLRDIVGYKLSALLLYRLEGPRGARETLFGDDREHDPDVYTLYSRVCAGLVRGQQLVDALLARNVGKAAAKYAAALASELPQHDPVEWIFIRKLGRPETAPPPADEDPRVLRVSDFCEAAALLHALGRVSDEDLGRVLAAVTKVGGGCTPAAALDRALLHSPLEPAAVARTRATLAALAESGATCSPEVSQ